MPLTCTSFTYIANTTIGQVITYIPTNPTKHPRSAFLTVKHSNFSNIASLLWHAYAALPSPSSSVNWAGFYIRQDKFPHLGSQNTPSNNNNNILLLGPFQGRPACQEIRFGRGVCGSAAEKRETVIVPDVLSFPGHIACDASSRSEIVVPILVGGEVSLLSSVEGVLCCVADRW
jgi:L-methionine (R)-S-oxide reductase